MQCDRAADLIGAYLDQELDADARREVAAHLGGCSACANVADELRRISRRVAAVGREPAPAHLAPNVRTLLAGSAGQAAQTTAVARAASLRAPGWVRQAAAILVACGVTAAATALVMSRTTETSLLERDVTAAHVRSLLQDSAVQVASSDSHTVKPWFAGRLDFAPVVKDLALEGFPLAGARLDYVGDRRVAALVYRRRLHVLSVFLWPSTDGVDRAPRELVHKGYNVLTWNRGGIVYWAISDLNIDELRQLEVNLQ
jgi:anti-sigma factor RsiW